MNFVSLENKGKKLFNRFPRIKRMFKRVYQVSMYAMSHDKVKSEGNIVRITPNDGFEYFFGYYDKSPWDAEDRYMIALKTKCMYKSVAPNEEAEIVLIDTKNENKITTIAKTFAWNVQQGCMAQWLGPDFKTRIIYNDFRNGKYVSVIYNVLEEKEEKELALPVYAVSLDGKFAFSLDFSRLHRLRKGYGYSNIDDKTKGQLCPESTCIWKLNLDANEVTEILKYTDLLNFEQREEMIGAEHKVNHIMISPDGTRFMFLHRWFKNGEKYTRLVTADIDRSNLYNLNDDNFTSHCCWKNNDEILSFMRKFETGDHYYLMKDKTKEHRLYWEELNTDGHCTYSPDGRLVVTDTYPNRKRMAYVYICEGDNVNQIAKVFSPFKYDNDVRCDLHPRWNHTGDKICIDSVHEGKTGLYVINI